jgi:FecR-like protein
VESELQEAQMADVQVDEGIEVRKLEGQEQQSYSILDFSDYLEVELFSNTSVFLADLHQETGGAGDVTLHLNTGHIFVHANDQTTARVTVQTPFATIRTLTGGTEFDVCHNGTLTCVLVTKGVVEVTARNKNEILTAGTAGYVLEDQSPSAHICAPTPKFSAWEDRFRQSADTPPLENEMSELPQEPCPLTEAGIPVNAQILYQDYFTSPLGKWERGKIDNYIVRYAGLNYYRVQAQYSGKEFVPSAPTEDEYGDVNIDIRAIAEAPGGGDFRYGLVLRRSGDQYYAFVIAPSTKKWYFLKSSSDGLEILREGTDERMRGLDAREALRVEAYGSTFLLVINGRFIDWISDSDYASGEVGVFVETIDNSDVLIGFNSITIWDIPATDFNPNQGENCFNATDDDGDGWIDQADPNCQRPELSLTSLPTSPALPTSTPGPVGTPTVRPPPTQPPLPTLIPPLPTLIPPLPTIQLPLPTIQLPLPTIVLPLPIVPPVGTPMPE